MIHLTKLDKYYKTGTANFHALKNIELKISKGEFVSVTGASGSGKSTLLNILGILDCYSSGQYLFNDVEVKYLSEKSAAKFRNSNIGFVFQSYNLIAYYSALENIALPLYYRGLSIKERISGANEVLSIVGLTKKSHHYPHEMSGGEQQRTAIARAIVNNPDLILADEPTGALDSNSAAEVMDLLVKLNQLGHTVVIVTHNMEVAGLANRVVTLSDGCIGSDRAG